VTGDLQGEYGKFVTAEPRNHVESRNVFQEPCRREPVPDRLSLWPNLSLICFSPSTSAKTPRSRDRSATEFQFRSARARNPRRLVYAGQFVAERKAAQFCLQHVLLHGALKSRASGVYWSSHSARCRMLPRQPTSCARLAIALASSPLAFANTALEICSTASFPLRKIQGRNVEVEIHS